ncbi:UDP pyrophosphate synthetase [Salmonella enterica subsp. enterica]|uniref:UDP pyrophosphate synthetase n=1 Tax=Salmonella enterica I TaxID=59201 RepID=A0A3S4J5X0_SALET|nr:UDP pyrophosphate synthetase [Salmonella enterica subsp. enterica]
MDGKWSLGEKAREDPGLWAIKPGRSPVRRAVSFAANNGIDALTLYAFSSENWNRPAQEVSALMELFCVGRWIAKSKPAPP